MPNTQNTLESKLSSSPVPTLGVVPKKPKKPTFSSFKSFLSFLQGKQQNVFKKKT